MVCSKSIPAISEDVDFPTVSLAEGLDQGNQLCLLYTLKRLPLNDFMLHGYCSSGIINSITDITTALSIDCCI